MGGYTPSSSWRLPKATPRHFGTCKKTVPHTVLFAETLYITLYALHTYPHMLLSLTESKIVKKLWFFEPFDPCAEHVGTDPFTLSLSKNSHTQDAACSQKLRFGGKFLIQFHSRIMKNAVNVFIARRTRPLLSAGLVTLRCQFSRYRPRWYLFYC